ncbi:hypothetical protein Tco_0877096 [Tanacetum coccineum]|uniref:Reverse transcriptase domain-containing protein n=1 Tax=Tanacetum coccineum TaxID=301880 RepID=A0ABQ5BU43_9ASTR
MSTSNQQTLADPRANERPLMLEKRNYIPWESRPMIPNPDNTNELILEPMSKMTEGNKKQYTTDVKVMNYLLQAIPNDIEPLENQAPPVVMMADQRTMAELLRAPTEGYAEAIVVPPIPAEHFELVDVENRYMVTLVDGVLANGVVMIFEMDIAFYAIQVANLNTYPSRHFNSFCYDDDDDDDKEYTIAITPDLPTEEPDNSLSMGDEHLDTIPKTESDELIKSSDENLVPIPSESEDFSNIESMCDVPDCDDSQTVNFSTFSNPLFDDSTSSDDESSHEEVIHEISFKTYSNPLFDLDEEIISSEFNPIHNEDLDSTPKNDRFDTESYLLESLLNRDTLMASSPKIDSLFDEFAGELITIPPRIVNREHEEYISLLERLLYDNSSPRPPEDFHANPNTIIESLPTFPIPVEDSDSLREEIDIFPGPDDSIPPGIESDDYDSEGDDNSTSLPEFESFHVDYPD